MKITELNLQKNKEYWLKTSRNFIQVSKLVPFSKNADAMPCFHQTPMQTRVGALLQKVSKGQPLQAYVLVMAGYALTAYRYTKNQQVGLVSPGIQQDDSPEEGLHIHHYQVLNDGVGMDLLKAVQQGIIKGKDHPYPDGDQLWQSIALLKEDHWDTLAQVGFAFEPLHRQKPAFFDSLPIRIGLYHQDDHFSWALHTATSDQAWFLNQFIQHWEYQLEQLLSQPKAALASYRWLTAAEETQLLYEMSGTEAPSIPFDTLHGYFEDTVQKFPDRTAVIGNSTYTYRELQEATNHMAAWLQAVQGVKPGDRVGLLLSRSERMIFWMLATLKAGATYIPLDPIYPADRIRMIVEEAQPSLCLVSEETGLLESDLPARKVGVDTHWEEASQYQGVPNANPSGDDLAYIIYTSGSTGRPKGVMLTHRNAAYLMDWARAEYRHLSLQTLYCATSISFDISVFEIFGGLSMGLTLRIFDNVLDTPEALQEDQHVLLCCVPSAMVQLLKIPVNWEAVEAVNLCGEPVPESVLKGLDCDRMEVRNIYGPTEDTVYDCYQLFSNQMERVLIGKPFPGHRMYVLDDSLQPVPVGVDGELCISGVGLSQGYYQRPDITKKAFVAHPFKEGEKLYRTGDLVRWLPDGTLDYRGRLDFQVKVRGFRVELGEIESRLLETDGAKEALVVAKKDEQDITYLVGYVVGDALPPEAAMQEQLAIHLPPYMVPSHLVALSAFPYLPNGKINRKALPDPQDLAATATELVPAEGPQEEVLLALFKEVLGREEVGVTHNFFALGGHSLKAFQLMRLVAERMQVNLAAQAVFQQPTVRELASHMEATQAQHHTATALLAELEAKGISLRLNAQGEIIVREGKDQLTEALTQALEDQREALMTYWRQPGQIDILADQASYPLSYSQKRLWILSQLEGTGAAYNMSSSYRLKGQLDEAALEKALTYVVNRHESLRTTLTEVAGEPRQVVNEPLQYTVELERYTSSPEAVDAFLAETNNKLYDLNGGKLFRALWIQLGDEQQMLVFLMHHIISDGWSLEVLGNDFGYAYQQYLKGEELQIAPLRIQYKEFSVWENQQLTGIRKDLYRQYWLQRFEGEVPVLDLPHDKPRPAIKTAAGAVRLFHLPTTAQQKIRQLSEEQGVTQFVMILAVVLAWLYRVTRQTDFVIGTPVAGRDNPELHNLVGFFTGTLALRDQVSGDQSLISLLEKVKVHTQEAFQHQLYPFDELVSDLSFIRDSARSPLFDLMVSADEGDQFMEDAEQDLDLKGLEVLPHELEVTTAQFDLTLEYHSAANQGVLVWVYNTDLFSEERIHTLGTSFLHFWEELVTQPSEALGSLPLMSETATQALLPISQGPQVAYPFSDAATILSQAYADHSSQTALRFEDQSWTYAALDQRTGQLAAWLQQQGIQQGDRAGLMANRTDKSIIALLAMVRLGVTFVPIDPMYPEDRVQYLLADSECKLLIYEQGENTTLLAAVESQVVALSAWWEGSQSLPPLPQEPLSAKGLAYILYTSGTSGKPKGVMISRDSMADYTQTFAEHMELTAKDLVIQQASLSFDTAVEEIFPILSVGGTLVVSAQGGRDAIGLVNLIQDTQATLLSTTPLVVEQLQPYAHELPSVRLLVSGGDELRRDQVATWLQHAQVYNTYGPTESTVCALYQEVTLDSTEGVIGKPIANRQAYLLNDHLQPVPMGVPGELCLGGAGLAQGYWKREAETARVFVSNPFQEGTRLYKTGDLGVMLPEGTIRFLGRKDKQVKINGYRVEVSEVEAALVVIPEIEEAAVRVFKTDSGQKYLCGYLVSSSEELDTRSIREALSKALPFYMVPRYLVPLEALPMTTNGKLDTKALPDPSQAVVTTVALPETPTEKALATAWESVLGQAPAKDDHFFVVGGNSLKAFQLMRRIQEDLGVPMTLQEVFQYPTLAEQAGWIDRESKDLQVAAPIALIDTAEHYPVSHAQRRLWILDQFEATGAAYNLYGGYRLHGPLHAKVLEGAWKQLQERHESLRTTFLTVENEPRQRVHEVADWPNPVTYRQVSAQSLAEALQPVLDTPFDLEQGPLVRVVLASESPQEHVLLVVMHHIISDGWSVEVLSNELNWLYNQAVAGNPATLAPLSIQYKDYAHWQNQQLSGQQLKEHLGYWLGTLEGELPVLDLPNDKPRPVVKTYAGALAHLTLPTESVQALRAIAKEQQATFFMLSVALTQALLHRYTRQDDMILGTPIAARERPELDGQIGFFVNTLALRGTVRGEDSLPSLLQRVKQNTLEAFDHQMVPFDLLVDALALDRNPSRSPLFDVMVSANDGGNFTENRLEEAEGETGPEVTDFTLSHAVSHFDLSIDWTVGKQNGLVSFEYNTDLFSAERMDKMAADLLRLIEHWVAAPDKALGSLSLLDDAQREYLLNAYQPKPKAYSFQLPQTLLSQAFDCYPQQVALRFEDQAWTYAELAERTAQMAHWMAQTHGVQPGDRLGLMANRTDRSLIALLAMVRMGVTFVPIDPLYPEERVSFLLEDSACSYLVYEPGEDTTLLNTAMLQTISLSTWWEGSGTEEGICELVPPASEALAYILYTSGTTGQPKGVMISQASMADYAQTFAEHMELTTKDVVIQQASLSFDTAIEEIFPILAVGGSLVVAPQGGRDAAALVALIQKHQATLLSTTPLVVEQLQHEVVHMPSLRLLVSGGDDLRGHQIKEWLQHTRVFNTYGPTESTVCALYHEVAWGEGDSLIGKPIANRQVYLLNEQLTPVPMGVPGEICLGGAGLALGYWQREEETQKAFVAHPFEAGQRLYKTGDLGLILPDGTIRFLGRKDKQVKINGYRVEVSEIEAAMVAMAEIDEAVVTVRTSEQGQKYLCGYWVSNGLEIAVRTLRDALAKALPFYMVPRYLMALPAMPMTTNGKLDYKALPDPVQVVDESIALPETETEKALAAVWESVLGQAPGKNDHFFVVGGNSLKAFQLMRQIGEKLDVQLTLQEVFRYPTLAEQAHQVEQQKGDFAAAAAFIHAWKQEGKILHPTEAGISVLPEGTLLNPRDQQALEQATPHLLAYWKRPQGIHPIATADHYPVSHAQRRLWILDQFEATGAAYNLYGGYRLSGPLHDQALEQAWQVLQDRHESLRTTFLTVDGEPRQRIHAVEDWVNPIAYQQVTAHQLMKQLQPVLDSPFHLQGGPLVRVVLASLSAEDHVLLIVMHHIISDGWSVEVLGNELSWLYDQAVAGKPTALPALPIQYKDYASWQAQAMEGPTFRAHIDHWLQELGGELPVLDLPNDKPRPAVKTYEGATAQVTISPKTVAQLQQLAKEHQATFFMVSLALSQAWLHRYTGQEDVILGTPIAGRERPELEGQIGFFVNTLALRGMIRGTDTLADLLPRVQQRTLQAFDHQMVPFDLLVDALELARDPSRSPLFDVMVSAYDGAAFTENALVSETQEDRPDVADFGLEQSFSHFDLTLDWVASPRGGIISLEYNTDLFSAERIAQMGADLVRMAERWADAPDMPLGQVPMVGKEQRRFLLDTYQPKPVQYPYALPWDMLDRQATDQPDSPAIWHEGQTVSYRELVAQAEQMARVLIADFELQPGDRLGLFALRHPDTLIALWACLKAGVVFVPIDPMYPSERVQYLAENSECQVLIVDDQPDISFAQNMRVETLRDWKDRGADQTLALPTVEPADLAYILYTSGTTGKPKGVMISHGSLVDYLQSIAHAIELGPSDTFLQQASLSFDTAIEEVFAPICAGGTVAIAPNGGQDIEGLVRIIQEAKVSVISTTPLVVEQLNAHVSKLPTVRTLISGGDELRSSHITEWRKHARIINSYGPTESTIAALFFEVMPDSEEGLIGQPMANREVYLLNDSMQLVPIGTPGELCLAGPGLAQGYWNRPEETEKAFVDHPFLEGEKLYRTGDLGVMRPNGDIRFLGRKDKQVKINGYRVEVSEVELVLVALPGVAEAAVTVVKSEQGQKSLCAYIVPKEDALDTRDLRDQLAALLPHYMVPRFIISIAALPMTTNGKLDVKALPAPAVDAEASHKVEPSNPMEHQLLELYAEVLEADLGVTDHFFRHGGHSLKAFRLLGRVEETLAISLPFSAIFQHPTVRELAIHIHSLEGQPLESSELISVPKSTYYPADARQRRMYTRRHFAKQPVAYTMSLPFPMEAVEPDLVLATAYRLMYRHAALRSSFTLRKGSLLLRVHEAAQLDTPFRVIDLRSEEDPRRSLQEALAKEATHLFDHHLPCQWQLTYYQLSEEEAFANLQIDHIISDGVTMTILEEELPMLFRRLRRGDTSMPALPRVDLQDYTAWQERTFADQRAERLAYWKQELAGLPASPSLPGLAAITESWAEEATRHYRSLSPEETSFAHKSAFTPRPLVGNTYRFLIPSEVGQDGLRLAETYKVGVFPVLFGAVAAWLHQLTGDENPVILSPFSYRDRAALQDMVGYFMEIPMVRLAIGEEPSLADLMLKADGQLEKARAMAYPFEQLLHDLTLPWLPSSKVLLHLRDMDSQTDQEAPTELLNRVTYGDSAPHAAFHLSADMYANGLQISCEFFPEIASEETIRNLCANLLDFIQSAIAKPHVPISELNTPRLTESYL